MNIYLRQIRTLKKPAEILWADRHFAVITHCWPDKLIFFQDLASQGKARHIPVEQTDRCFAPIGKHEKTLAVKRL